MKAKKFAVSQYAAQNYDDQIPRNDHMQERIQTEWLHPRWLEIASVSRQFKLL